MKNKKNIYLKIFLSTFYLSAFTIGGGFVIIPLMKKKFVDELHWIEEKEILNLIAIAQSSPGAVAVNASLIIGYNIAGIIGATVAVIGTVLPPLIILSIISLFYQAFKSSIIISNILKGMQSGVAAVIVDVVISMGRNIYSEKNIFSLIIMFCAFVANYFLSVNVIYIILIAAAICTIKSLIIGKFRNGGASSDIN